MLHVRIHIQQDQDIIVVCMLVMQLLVDVIGQVGIRCAGADFMAMPKSVNDYSIYTVDPSKTDNCKQCKQKKTVYRWARRLYCPTCNFSQVLR